MRVLDDKVEQSNDIITLIEELKQQYRTIYWTHINGDIYIYKPLGRKDYKDLCEDETTKQGDKEDKVVQLCVLYPYNLDIDNMLPGTFNELYKTIMENSCLASLDDRVNILNFYRNEMLDSFNQIPCIINEAFPQYDIEEIENWDVERTAKYLSRAEWKLEAFRNIVTDYSQAQQYQQQYKQEEEQEEVNNSPIGKTEKLNNKEKLKSWTQNPEKLRELKAKFPEIDWEHDSVMMEGAQGLQDSFNDLPVALRPFGQSKTVK